MSSTPKVYVGANSFADRHSAYDPECPAPKYFTEKLILEPLPDSKEEILKGLVINESGALVCTDQVTL